EAAGWLLERLCVLRDAEDVPGLLAAFGAFSEAMLLLNELTAKRLEQLPACPQRERLAQALWLLQQCVPRLHAAKLGHLQRACHQRGTLSEDYTFQLTERTITQLTSLLFNHPGSKEPGGRSGTFSQHVSSLLALLSGPAPAHLFASELSTHVAAVIFHCMLLADSSRLHLKLELVRHCWVLLRLRKTICSRTSRRQERPGRMCGASGPREDYRTMREEVEALDQAALRATLCQILDTFVEGEEPLRKLFEGTCSLAGCFPAEPGGFLKTLQPLTAKFFAHAQQMLRTTDFVLARCTHTPTAREIGEQLECLRGLLASLPALLTELSRDGDARPSAAERLRSLRRAWAVATRSLLWCFDRTVGTREFLGAALREMAEHGECCGRALRSRDAARFSQHAARLASWARWVVDATSRFVDRATDPFFRNGLLVWVEQLAKSILELKAVAALCSERPSCLHDREAFSEALSCLLEAAQHIQDGLDGSNHPDILSPLRDGARSTDVAMRLGLGSRCAGLKAPADAAALEEDPSTGPSSQPGEGDAHPVIRALLAAMRAHDTAAIKAACSALLDLCEGCVAAAQEALPAAEPPQLEVLGQYQKILLLTPHVVSLAREQAAPGQLHRPGGLLQVALTLSTRIRETEAALAAVAGPWYSLSQQVLGFIWSADLVRGKQALEETMMGLAGAVQLAGDIADVTCTMGNPISADTQESFLQVQAKLSRAQTNTQALLERAASLEEPGRVEKASLEMPCVRWAVGMHVVLAAVDKFTGRDVLLLRELGSAVKNKLCSPSLLAAVSENSLRLQEAARLSHLSCPEARGCSDILELREDIKVLTEALLDASNTLLASSLLTASLYTRFELLQRDLALRAKALLLHLEKVNTEHLQVIREVLGPALSPFSKQDKERSKQAFEEKASQLMANVCWVKTTLHDVLEAGAQENLLSVADHLVVLTLDAVGSASQLFQSHGGKEHFCWDSTLWYWSATAHYLSTQLRAVRGVSGHLLQLVGQRLRNTGGGCSPRQASSTATLLPAREPADLSHYKPAETCPSRTGRGSRAAGEA
ncbi:CTNA1 protein, partial [Rhinopomastus cyanomelas]|nr:CTNA1 protein [Rhinopomastus cyanomelas]